MTEFLQLVASGLALGVIYALIALGFVVIYRASKVFNFAHGDMLTFGAFMMLALLSTNMPWILALLLAMVSTGILGAGIERVFLRPLVGRPVFVTIIVTIFVGFLLRIGLLIVWGPEQFGLATPWDPRAAFSVGDTRLLYSSVAALVLGGVAIGAFLVLLRFSRAGIAMRAASQDQEAALALGLPVGRILGMTWFIAGAFAALAGVCLSMFPRTVEINLAFIALAAFPAVLVGGLESIAGAIIAGLALGVLQLLTQGYVNPALGNFGHNFHTVFPYFVMILFLVVRPYGLFGHADVKRV